MTRSAARNITAATALVATIALMALPASPASADSAAATATVAWTGIGIYPRSQPAMSADHVGLALLDGATVGIACELNSGDYVNNGAQTTDLWDQLPDGTWLPNAYLNTGVDGPTPGVPSCTASAPSASTTPSLPILPIDRESVRNWALAHAKDPELFIAPGCTWFVSQALFAGGAPMDDTWTMNGSHSHGLLQGSVTAWSADQLVTYLEAHYSVTVVPLTFSPTTNAVPQAEPGDIIAYKWDSPTSPVNHLSLVTGSAPGDYPLVSEWGVGSIINAGATQYQQRGWTYSANSNQWLQWSYPNVSAVLLHFNDPQGLSDNVG